MELISMTCRSCGGKLKITKDTDQFICQHCGTEYLVSFTEGAISIKLLSEGIQKIQASTDKTASELALTRIKKEKEEIYQWNLAVYYYCKYLMDQVNYTVNEGTETAPNIWLKVLNAALKAEKSKGSFFRDQKRIDEIEMLVKQGEYYVRKWPELLNQETYHRQIVGKL